MSETREEFEAAYNGGDIIPLLMEGRLSIECRCDYEECKGWKMTDVGRLPDDLYLYGNSSSEVAEALWHRTLLLNKAKLDGKKIV